MASPVDAPEPDAPVFTDVGPPACAIDRSCPERAPNPGAFCEGELSCEYSAGGDCRRPWVADCVSGEWALTEPACEPRARPLTGERCTTPFEGSAEGTVSLVLPRDRLVVGTQGSPMLPIEITLDGAAQSLDCVHVASDLRIDGEAFPVPSGVHLRLRCGSSTGYLLQFDRGSTDVCDGAPHEFELGLDVVGVGSTSASVTITGCD